MTETEKKCKSWTKLFGNGQNQIPDEDLGITFRFLAIRRVNIYIYFFSFRSDSITRDASAIPQGRLYSTRPPLFHEASFIPQGRLCSTRPPLLNEVGPFQTHPMTRIFSKHKTLLGMLTLLMIHDHGSRALCGCSGGEGGGASRSHPARRLR